MEPKEFKARINERKEIAKNVFEITFILTPEFHFRAGQYVWIILPKLNYADPKGERRAFSISSSPNTKGSISICLKKSESGYNITLFELPVGGEVTVIGPCGSLTLPEKTSIPIVMVTGGTGIAPFFSMIRFATENKIPQKITLNYANHNREQAPYLSELSEYAKTNTNFELKNIFGRMTYDFARPGIDDPQSILWYVVGPKGMVDEIGRKLHEHGVPDSNQSYEQYYPLLNQTTSETEALMGNVTLLKTALENTSIHIIVTDINGVIVFANAGAEQITKFSKNEILGQTPRLWGSLMPREFYKNLWTTIKMKQEAFIGEVKNRRKNGEIYYAILHITPILEENKPIGFMATETDISLQRKIQLELAKTVIHEKELEEAKTEFLSITSHQLRTPLGAMRWNLELLLSGDMGNLTDLSKKSIEQLYGNILTYRYRQ